MASAEEKRLYQSGLRDFEAGNLTDAEATFADFMGRYPQSDLADNALYQLGMLYCMTGRKAKGLETFRACVKAYAGSDAAPLAAQQARVVEDEMGLDSGVAARELFHKGRDKAAAGDFDGAKELFLRCVEEYPDSVFSDNVYLSLSMVYSHEGHFAEARRMLELILENFPDSDAAGIVPAALKQLERDEKYS